MSGRRMRKAINATLQSVGMPNGTQVVIAGLSNTYSDYIVTYEEYQVRKKGTIENVDDNSRFFDSRFSVTKALRLSTDRTRWTLIFNCTRPWLRL